MRIGWTVIGGIGALCLAAVFALADPPGLAGDAPADSVVPDAGRGPAPETPDAASAVAAPPAAAAALAASDDRRESAQPAPRTVVEPRAPLAAARIDDFAPAERAAVQEVLATVARDDESPMAAVTPFAALLVVEVESVEKDWANVLVRAEAPALALTSGRAVRVKLAPQASAAAILERNRLPTAPELAAGEVRTLLVVMQLGELSWAASGPVRGT